MAPAIVVDDLRKSYGDVAALRGVTFQANEGEVFGLLGPNGAGKTTTVEILEGYRSRDGGSVSVLGHDPGDSPRELRERIGVVLQQSELSTFLTVRETHALFAGYYARPRDVDEVIDLVGLTEKRDARVKTLSGGQKRRLDLGVALIGDPELVFLDEPDQELQRRGLASAVRPEKAEDLAGVDGERDIVHDRAFADDLGQVFGDENHDGLPVNGLPVTGCQFPETGNREPGTRVSLKCNA